jgi:hypothetical protein
MPIQCDDCARLWTDKFVSEIIPVNVDYNSVISNVNYLHRSIETTDLEH